MRQVQIESMYTLYNTQERLFLNWHLDLNAHSLKYFNKLQFCKYANVLAWNTNESKRCTQFVGPVYEHLQQIENMQICISETQMNQNFAQNLQIQFCNKSKKCTGANAMF